MHIYIYMKPAWNSLYEMKVRCGRNDSPSLVGVGYVAGHSHWFLFIPGSCVELLTNSGGGDHGLHQSCLPLATQNSPCWTHLRRKFQNWECRRSRNCACRVRGPHGLAAETLLGLAQVLALPQAGECPASSQQGQGFLHLPSPLRRKPLDLMTVKILLWV